MNFEDGKEAIAMVKCFLLYRILIPELQYLSTKKGGEGWLFGEFAWLCREGQIARKNSSQRLFIGAVPCASPRQRNGPPLSPTSAGYRSGKMLLIRIGHS